MTATINAFLKAPVLNIICNILKRILYAALAIYAAAILAVILLIPDVVVQLLFMVPASLYLYTVFRGLEKRWFAKRNDGVVPEPEHIDVRVFLLIDLVAITCGSGLVYFGIKAPFFREFEALMRPDTMPSLLPVADIWSIIAGVSLIGIGLYRMFLRKSSTH